MKYLAFSLLVVGAAAGGYGGGGYGGGSSGGSYGGKSYGGGSYGGGSYGGNSGQQESGWTVSVSESPSGTSSGSATTHTVIVGGTAGLIYSPSSITANGGDVVEFQFMQTNHTVTQSSFDTPCIKLEGGVDSGFMPNPGNSNPPPTFQFKVPDSTTPQWFYCRQKVGTHCGKGMVFSINASQTKTFDAYKQNALNQNGTQASLTSAGIQAASPPPSVSSTVTIVANGAASTGSSQSGQVVQGTGQQINGQFQCTCLCGTTSLAAGVGIGSFGGVGGELPSVWSAVQQAAVDNNGTCNS